MASRWVGKPHPAVRRGDAAPADGPLLALHESLATLIGRDNIGQMSWRRGPDGDWLGAFEITDTGWDILTTGIAGPQGFEPLD